MYTPTLTGLADRSHLLDTRIVLDTHIADIVNLFKWEEIRDAVLVAHSYGGWPVSGALESIADRVSSVVFLDAFMPENGQRGMDLSSRQSQEALTAAVRNGEAGRPAPGAASFRIIRPEDSAWVQAKMTPQPTGVSLTPIKLTGARDRVRKKTYVRAPAYAQSNFDRHYQAAQSDASWTAISLPPEVAGHDIMVDAPEKLAEILLAAR